MATEQFKVNMKLELEIPTQDGHKDGHDTIFIRDGGHGRYHAPSRVLYKGGQVLSNDTAKNPLGKVGC